MGSLSQQPETAEVEAQRAASVQAMLDRLLKSSVMYGTFMDGVTITNVTRGTVTTSIVLDKRHMNSKDSLHGAVSATMIDFTTGLAIGSWDMREATGASVDMHISYLSTAKSGDKVEIVTTADRVGGSLAFVTIKIAKVNADGSRTMVTTGQHTKFVKGTAPTSQASRS